MIHAEALNQARRYNDPSQDARNAVRNLSLAGFGISVGDTLILQPFHDGKGLVVCCFKGQLHTMPASRPLSDIVGKIIAYVRGGRLFHVEHQSIQ